jgi:hypothetical protein
MLSAAIALALAGCTRRIDRKVGRTLETVDMKAPFLKAHMKNGDVFVLERWQIDEAKRAITGPGEHHGPDRTLIGRGTFTIFYADVALYESNTIVTSPAVAALAVVTGLSAVVTIACLANPKACFGSCPTFYAKADDGTWALQAEGFSEAIAPSLEQRDVDALWRTTGRAGPFTIRMTNEAYETHVVKQADVLAVPRPAGGRVLSTGDRFYATSALHAPVSCTSPEGSCLPTLGTFDGNERLSLSDPDDLATRETIELAFPPVSGRAGIVLGARQGMVTTFLLYQGLAYLGTQASGWLAMLERDQTSLAAGRALKHLVGGIEVQIQRAGSWETVGTVDEVGPLATDVHLVLLPPGATGERIRLRLPMGAWRLDHAAVVSVSGEVTPKRLAPRAIRGRLGEYGPGRKPATAFPMVTMPGDSYEFEYAIPAGEHELFLDTRGYYLEWMRREWLREENPVSAMRMLLDPEGTLRALAPAYKKVEPHIEEMFWRSRYARP